MRHRVLFILSLILIIALSWANVDYFGTSRTNVFSPAVNQVVHLIALLLTGVIGYINWRHEDKWVNQLWIGLYAGALLLFAGSVAVFYVTHSEAVKRIGASLRNHFTEPLPFLVFFLFVQLTKRFKNRQPRA